jgi:DNA polymerase-3 subunit delta'
MASHGIATARWLQRKAALSAAQGGWRIYLVGNADRLVPQESSPEAANALLKLLEEPPTRSLFVLTATEPGLILGTIRSRSVPIRVARVSDAAVEEWARSRGVEPTAEALGAARGAIGRLEGEGATAERSAREAARAMLALADGEPAERAMAALKRSVAQARGDFTVLLDAMADELGRRARAAGGSRDAASRALVGLERVMAAREQAQGNVNPQLLLAVLLDDLAAVDAR